MKKVRPRQTLTRSRGENSDVKPAVTSDSYMPPRSRIENLRKLSFRFYERVQPLIAPGLRNAQFDYRDMLEHHVKLADRWLDIGCGRRLFPEWMPQADEHELRIIRSARSVFGIDPDFASLADNRIVAMRVAGDGSSLPFADDSFDLLTANMVVEHVADPDALLREARRILKPGGLLIFHTPNLHSYATFLSTCVPESWKKKLVIVIEGRKEEDVFPTLYRMNLPSRIQALAEKNGFRVTQLCMAESSAQGVVLGPLVLLELIWIRMLRLSLFRGWRSNIIAVLQKVTDSAKKSQP
jgi:ubiquinone/menaquinone biosynthesis C-methylase UbiE